MQNQTLIMTGATASTLCFGLLDTGKFFRLSRVQTDYAAQSDTETLSQNLRALFRPSHSKPETQNTRNEQKKQKPDSKEKNTNEGNNETPTPPYRKPVLWKDAEGIGEDVGNEFIVCGPNNMVEAVLSILRIHKRDFRLKTDDNSAIWVECIGSQSRAEEVLREIQAAL